MDWFELEDKVFVRTKEWYNEGLADHHFEEKPMEKDAGEAFHPPPPRSVFPGW